MKRRALLGIALAGALDSRVLGHHMLAYPLYVDPSLSAQVHFVEGRRVPAVMELDSISKVEDHRLDSIRRYTPLLSRETESYGFPSERKKAEDFPEPWNALSRFRYQTKCSRSVHMNRSMGNADSYA